MKKGKAITLLSIISFLMVALIFFTFVRFSFDGGIKKYNSALGAVQTEYDISGGRAYTLTLAKDNIKDVEDINEVTDTLSTRLEALGYDVYKVTALKSPDLAVTDYDIRIELKAPIGENGMEDTATLDSDMQVVSAYGELKFYGGSEANPTEEIEEFSDIKVIKDAKYVGAVSNGSTTYYQTQITFTDDAYSVIAEKLNAGAFYFRISLGDVDLLSGADALSKDYFMDNSISLTTSTELSAKQCAVQIKHGALPYKYELSQGVSITSPYNFNASLIAIIVIGASLVLSLVYFGIKHRGFAIVALLSFILFICLSIWMFILIPGIKISLGGLVGIILSSILTIDGFIIIFKRITEENEKGKTAKFSITTGQGRALKPLLGMGVFAVVLALPLFFFAKGLLKGFAITFGISAVISVIATTLFVRMFISLLFPLVKNKEGFFNLHKNADGKEAE